jgi:hypothetical protein
MYDISWHITLGGYSLKLLDSAEIHASVDLLADTATIKLPAMNLNKSLGVESKLKIGDAVVIQAGYDGKLETEFEGFIQRIATDDGSITLGCEDGLYQFRKPVPDKAFSASTVKDVAGYVAGQIGGFSVVCDYSFTYDKFIITQATGYDVLKKLQEESKANIYLKGSELHIHPAYTEKFGEASFDFARNIEKSSLTYKRADERKFEVEVEGIAKDGKRVSVVIGTPGGDKRSIKIYGVSDTAALKSRGEEEMKRISYDGYEGSITCWFKPICRPGYTVNLKDEDYPEKDGGYYVPAVTTKISQAGIERTIQLGQRLS